MNKPGLKIGLVLAIIVGSVGCRTGTLPDPNDPNDVTVVQPDVLRNSLAGAADALNDRLSNGEIGPQDYERYMAMYANQLLANTKLDAVPPNRAWEYAEVFRTAERWNEAEVLLKVAVKAARTEDRRVNDSLRLAQVEAKLNNLPEAIRLARSTFDTKPQEKAPILTAILLEVVPAGEGKGDDVGLAKLLEDAIPQAEQTVVDPKTEAGAAFEFARPHHIRNAWNKVIELYDRSGHHDLALRAMQSEDEHAPRLDLNGTGV